jgi:outer membrane protein insertion porin family
MRLPPQLLLLPLLLGLAPTAVPAAERICEIEIEGNRRLTRDAFLFELRIKEGDPYDPVALKREFQRLYDRGLFEDIRLEMRRRPDCRDLRFTVKERPNIVNISYDEVKSITQQNIDDAYRERKIDLRVGSPFNRKTLYRAERVIEDLLGQKGYLGARVSAEDEYVSESSRKVHFSIRTGPKTKIKKIEFEGNEVFSDRKLKKTLKLTKAKRWYWPFGGQKTLYHPLKYQQDIQNVVDLYLSHGYLDVDLKPPVVEVKEADPEEAEKAEQKAEKKYQKKLAKYEKKVAKAEKKGEPPPDPPVRKATAGPKRSVYLSVRVDEGLPYDLGSFSVEGNEVVSTEFVMHALARAGLREGERLNEASLSAALEGIRANYGQRGYIYADVGRQIVKRPEGEIADVVITIDEDRQYSVERIEFEGNTVTQDMVLRREMRVIEGELLNRLKLDLSVVKLNQLGYWRPTEEPILEPIPGEDRVRVRVRGQEESRNELQVGGGYSELEGAFFAGSFRTSNFLGRGETLGISAQIGGRSRRAQLSFTEPWFMGKPITLGFSLFRREEDYGSTTNVLGQTQRLRRQGAGGRILVGKRLTAFSSLQFIYAYENVLADDVTTFSTVESTIASITPVYNYDRTNHPWRPNRGLRVVTTLEVSAGAVGSDNDYLRPVVDAIWYRPMVKNHFAGVHARAGWIRAFGDADELDPTLISGVPNFERFYTGGDIIGPRIYETRSLSPVRWRLPLGPDGEPLRDASGNPFPAVPIFVGGSKMFLLQLEYAIPLGEPATLAFFYDMGNAFDNGVNINFEDMRMSAGIEARLYLPVFQAPIRLIYGWPINDKPGDRVSRFQFSIGRSF